MLASPLFRGGLTSASGSVSAVAVHSAARATASASDKVTESTPGLAPAAVTQCTPSVGTPKANRLACARP